MKNPYGLAMGEYPGHIPIIQIQPQIQYNDYCHPDWNYQHRIMQTTGGFNPYIPAHTPTSMVPAPCTPQTVCRQSDCDATSIVHCIDDNTHGPILGAPCFDETCSTKCDQDDEDLTCNKTHQVLDLDHMIDGGCDIPNCPMTMDPCHLHKGSHLNGVPCSGPAFHSPARGQESGVRFAREAAPQSTLTPGTRDRHRYMEHRESRQFTASGSWQLGLNGAEETQDRGIIEIGMGSPPRPSRPSSSGSNGSNSGQSMSRTTSKTSTVSGPRHLHSPKCKPAAHLCSWQHEDNTVCGARFVCEEELEDHLIAHRDETGENICRWVECGHSTQQKGHLIAHLRKHSRYKPYICTHVEGGTSCNARFADPKALKKHSESQHQGKRFGCTDCDKSYASQALLDHHRAEKHGDGQRQMYPCKYCEMEFNDRANREAHQKVQHESQSGRTSACKLCRESFAKAANTKRHLHNTCKEAKRLGYQMIDGKFYHPDGNKVTKQQYDTVLMEKLDSKLCEDDIDLHLQLPPGTTAKKSRRRNKQSPKVTPDDEEVLHKTREGRVQKRQSGSRHSISKVDVVDDEEDDELFDDMQYSTEKLQHVQANDAVEQAPNTHNSNADHTSMQQMQHLVDHNALTNHFIQEQATYGHTYGGLARGSNCSQVGYHHCSDWLPANFMNEGPGEDDYRNNGGPWIDHSNHKY